MDDSTIIDKLGGTAAVARMCDVQPPSVSQWRREGIPRARRQYLELLHPEVFPREQAPRPGGTLKQPQHAPNGAN